MMKQFRKKDYKFRYDLGGTCINYCMDWFYNEDGTCPDSESEYYLAYEIFHKRKELLNIGEYFSMKIFGHKIFAYRNENGIFTK